jgi:hypothetical protein
LVDFNVLRKRIAEASRLTFEAVRAAHPEQRFYAFALYTVDDAVAINPSMNSEEAYHDAVARETADEENTRWLISNGISPQASLLGDHRWSAFDWEFDCAESDSFEAINELINNRGAGIYDEGDALGFEKFKAGVMASMVLALSDVIASGAIADRIGITLFCSVADSEDAVWFEEDSARRLNSSTLFQAFHKERITYISEDRATDDIAAQSVRGLYLAHLQATGGVV